MPEGDTIHRMAEQLRPVLVGQRLVRFHAPRVACPHPRAGEKITGVEAVGKHLLIEFGGGLTLQSHMGMSGSWRVFAGGQRWSKPAHLARAVIEVERFAAVCFAAPTLRLVATADRELQARLGPDLCRPDADLRMALERMATVPEPGTSVDEVLLDQRVMAGVGNEFKSETLWACRVHPFTPIERVDVVSRKRLIETAARLLRANVPGPTYRGALRTTVSGPPGSVAVYGRSRSPCRRCGTPIRRDQRGPLNRSTYWCPTCQPPP